MPLILDDEQLAVDSARLSFRDRLRAGRVTPIVSDDAVFDLMLGGYQPFLARYAQYVKYKLPEAAGLVSLIKYQKHRRREKPLTDQALKFDYLNFVKNHIYRMAQKDGVERDVLEEAISEMDRISTSAFANRLGYPRFGDRDDPLLILANLPFRTILTTSPYTFIEDALRRAGKSPRTEACRWTQALQDSIPSVIDGAYSPTAAEPLVYHLLGVAQYVDSLVLTEDDFLDYLGNLCEGQGNHATDFIPALVRRTFSDDLAVLGFHLDSWAFRVLYAGLIKRSGKSEDRGVCGIQLPNSEEERTYWEDYLEREAKFQVYWGTLEAYAREELRT